MPTSKFSPEYVRYINSVHWRGVREKALIQYGRRCAGCMASDVLHLHHLFYPKSLFDSSPDHLLPLCKSCHEIAHNQSLFHPTVFYEIECGKKRRETIIYIQAKVSRLKKQAEKGVRPWLPSKKEPTVIQLSPRYGPRNTKTCRYISASSRDYIEKLYR